MDIILWLIPASLLLGGVGLAAFFWALRHRQFDDPQGDASRILKPDWEDHPAPHTLIPAGKAPLPSNEAPPDLRNRPEGKTARISHKVRR